MSAEILIAYAIPVFLILLGTEFYLLHKSHFYNKEQLVGYELKDTVASLSMGLGYLAISLPSKGVVLACFFWIYEFRIFEIGNSWWAWVLIMISQDFCYYWYHRFYHEIRFFWAAHVNHHSSQHYNLSTALRQSWTATFTAPLFYMPLFLLGFHPLMVMTAILLNLFYQYWIHTETIGKLGMLEKVLMTASHHRVHHGTNPEYLDRNYGGVFILWDKLFGSFEPEKAPVEYGLVKNIHTFNPIKIAFHEWKDLSKDIFQTNNWKDRMGYMVMHPGWKPKSNSEIPIREEQVI